MNRPYRPRLAALLLAQIALTASVQAQTTSTWDNGGADNNINTAANWNLDTLPAFTNASQAIFQTASTVNVNVDATFGPLAGSPGTPAVQFANNFTLSAGGGSLVLFATNTGATPVLRSNTGSSATVINAPVRIITSPASAPRGNLLNLHVNNTTATNTGLTLTGGLSRDPASTGAATYDLRFTSAAAKAKISGPISGLGTLVNNQATGNNWAGDLIIAGNQTLTSTSNITFAAGTAGIPTDTGRLILGETTADVQAWNVVTLNNKIKLVIGGNITANSISAGGSAASATTRIVGYNASNSNLFLNGGTVSSNLTIGGIDTNENNLNLIKNGNGTLTINGAHTHTGSTTANSGTLALNGTIASPIIINPGATLSGEGSTTGSLTFAPGASTLSFDPNTQLAALSAGSLSATGSSVVLSPSGTLANGTPYTVLKLTNGTFSGSPTANFLLGSRGGSLSYTNNGTELTVTGGAATAATLIWTGNNSTNPTFWDAATTVNWTNNSTADRFYAGDSVIFDDTATSTAVAIQSASIAPGAITFNNSSKNYTLSGGFITGTTGLTKSGAGNLTLSTTGTSNFSGGVTLNDGALEFSALTQLGSLTTTAQINGGTLRFNGAATVTGNLPLTVNGNSTIDVSSNATITIRIGGKVSGAGNITKSGTGVLALGLNSDASSGNDFTGTLAVTGGTLDIRHSDSMGAVSAGTSIDNATLLMQNFGQTSGSTISYAEPLAFSGTSYLTLLTQEAKNFTHQFTGPVSVAGTLNVATAVTPSAVANATVLAFTSTGSISTATDSTLAFGSRPAALPVIPASSNQTITVAAPISGNGSVLVNAGAGAVITFDANNTYTGNTTVTTGTLKLNSASLPDTTTLNIATGGNAKLDLSASDTVNKLFIGSTQQNAGTYTSADASGVFIGAGTLTVTTGPAPSNTAPTVTDITNQSIPSGASTTALSFTVDDAETPVGLLTLTGSSSNTSLVPNGNIVFGGTGANRTVTVTPISGNTGTATITITVTDDGSPALSNTPAETFVLTVTENYLSWAKTNGIEGQPASADFDGDGISNLLEYATNTSPTASGGTAGFSVAPSGNNLALTYTRIADPALTYSVEGSSDLTGAWSALAVAGNPSTGVANVAGNVTITDPTPFTSGKRFLRLKVSQP